MERTRGKYWRKKLTCLVLALGLFFLSDMPLEAEKIEVEATLGLYKDYVWRGLVINDQAVLQPSLTLNLPFSKTGALALDLWGNFDLTSFLETKGKFSEVDITASYFHSLKSFQLEIGFIHYTFPHTDSDSTTEVYFSASYMPRVVPLSLTLGLYYDFMEIDGFYGSVGVESSINLTQKLSLATKLSAGYGDADFNLGYFGAYYSGFVDGVVSLALDYEFSSSFSLAAGLQFMHLIGSALRASVPNQQRDKLTASLSAGYSF